MKKSVGTVKKPKKVVDSGKKPISPPSATPSTAPSAEEDDDEGYEQEEDDQEEGENWRTYKIHPELHSHLEEFVQTGKHNTQHKAVRFFKNKINQWWHDEEPDDEHDVKRMKHIFHIVNKVGKNVVPNKIPEPSRD